MHWLLILILLTCNVHAANHHPKIFLQKIMGDPHEGQLIVNHYCATCHAQHPLIPLGAPRQQKLEDWQPRLKQNLKQLFKHVDEGFNAMPARGGCFECTDHQLYLAILALLPKSTKLECDKIPISANNTNIKY